MLVGLDPVQHALAAQLLEDGLGDLGGVLTREATESLLNDPGFIDRSDRGQVVLAPELVVLLTTAGRDVNDPGAFFGADLLPRDHPMADTGLRGKVVERSVVLEVEQARAGKPVENLVAALWRHDRFDSLLDQVVDLVVLPDLGVGEFRVDGAGDVRGQGPRRGGPDQQVLVIAAQDRQPHSG